MRNTKVEVIILPVSPQSMQVDYTALDNLCGSLRKYANPGLIPGEKNAWRKTVMEKAAQGDYDCS